MENIDEKYWWEEEEHKTTIPLPVSIIKDEEYWVVVGNSETKKLLGDKLNGSGFSESREEAINQYFETIKVVTEFYYDDRLNYIRFVPFIKGNWKNDAGKWFSVFGFNFYFRYGDKMLHGWYIPFTKLNISVTNQWSVYKSYKLKLKENAV